MLWWVPLLLSLRGKAGSGAEMELEGMAGELGLVGGGKGDLWPCVPWWPFEVCLGWRREWLVCPGGEQSGRHPNSLLEAGDLTPANSLLPLPATASMQTAVCTTSPLRALS